LPFKCNLQRYTAALVGKPDVYPRMGSDAKVGGGGCGTTRCLNSVDSYE
jgi:hypothetical protein